MKTYLSGIILSGIVLSIAISACSTPEARPTSTPAPTAALTPYLTSTATATPTPTDPATPTPLPTATPTPLTHTVQRGEDMFGISLRYKISLDALKAANPEVDPRAISVGAVLIIPATAQPLVTASLPAPTPVTVGLEKVNCSPDSSGGAWCFLAAKNQQDFPVENVTAAITLQGSNLVQTASTPLNRIPAGEWMALYAFFPGPISQPEQASASLLTALPVPPTDTRYLAAHLEQQQQEILEQGLMAEVSGELHLDTPGGKAARVWVAITALDSKGQIVGVRRWENQAPLLAGSSLPLIARVYSTGSPIASVQVLVEAAP